MNCFMKVLCRKEIVVFSFFGLKAHPIQESTLNGANRITQSYTDREILDEKWFVLVEIHDMQFGDLIISHIELKFETVMCINLETKMF